MTRAGLSTLTFLLTLEDRSMSLGSTSLLPGSRMKSRKVNTFLAEFSFERNPFGKGRPCRNRNSCRV